MSNNDDSKERELYFNEMRIQQEEEEQAYYTYQEYINELEQIYQKNVELEKRMNKAVDLIEHHITAIGTNNYGSLKRAIRVLKGE